MARVFRFSLEKVLELREWEEEQAEHALAAKTGECTVCQRKLEDLGERRHRTALQRGRGGLDLGQFAAHEAYRLRLTREIDREQKVLARLTLEREDLISSWKKARQKREALSNLRERQHRAFKKDVERRETLQIDDLNTASYIRKLTVEGPLG